MLTKDQAEEILKTLGREELLFSHHTEVNARPEAYERLAELVNERVPSLNKLRDEALRIAVEHGFKDASVGEDVALFCSEAAELLEDHRDGNQPLDYWYERKVPAPRMDLPPDVVAPSHVVVRTVHRRGPADGVLNKLCGIPSEVADVVIRVLHFCGKHGIDIDWAVREKMEYNATREFRHGKTL